MTEIEESLLVYLLIIIEGSRPWLDETRLLQSDGSPQICSAKMPLHEGGASLHMMYSEGM